MVLKALGVLGAAVGGVLIESAAVARAREATPSCEDGICRMLVRVGLRRPRRLCGVNIVSCDRVELPRWAGSSADGSGVARRVDNPRCRGPG